MNVTILQLLLKDYRNNIYQKNQTVGSIIKHYRQKRSLTLEETAGEGCSISYLSKVENNQIIPSNKILPYLVKRLNINEEIFQESRKTDWIEAVIKDISVSDKLYQENKNLVDYKSKIIKYAYYIFNLKSLEKAYQSYMELKEYFSHFAEEEMNLFLFIVMKHYYLMERYHDVVRVYNELVLFKKNERILVLAKSTMLKALYKLNRLIDINQRYEKVVNVFIENNYIKEINELRNYQVATLAMDLPTKQLREKLAMIRNNENVNFDYIWFIHYFYSVKNYSLAIESIKKIKHIKEHYLIMYLITLDKSKKTEEIIDAINQTTIEFKRFSYHLVFKYLKIKYLAQKELKFIRYELMNIKFISEEAAIMEYLFLEIKTILKNEHYYKDAVKVLEIQNNYLKEKNTRLFNDD